MIRRLITYITVTYLALWSLFFPSVAHATVKIKCEELPNKYWHPHIAKNYARSIMLTKYGWGRTEYKALNKLWTSESHWNPSAYNHVAGNREGDHAGGIPQILALDPRTPAPLQIERGLAYILSRYGKPSVAWNHHRKHGWY